MVGCPGEKNELSVSWSLKGPLCLEPWTDEGWGVDRENVCISFLGFLAEAMGFPAAQ